MDVKLQHKGTEYDVLLDGSAVGRIVKGDDGHHYYQPNNYHSAIYPDLLKEIMGKTNELDL